MRAQARPTVLVVGHVTHDRYGDDIVAGGCAYYGARTHHALGAEVRLVTTVGEDFAADRELAALDARVHRAGATTTFTNHYGPDGRRVQHAGATAPAITLAQLPATWRACDVLHLAPVMGELDLVGWLGAVDARLVVIGVQGWVKGAVGADVVQRPWAVDAEVLAGVDVACVGDEDLRAQGDLLERLIATVPIVAFTHGRAGCELIVRGHATTIGVHPAREVDPTGAGDTFAAALASGLACGAAPIAAAQLAAAAASIVVEARGGEALGRVAEAWRRAEAVPVAAARARP